VPLASGVSPQWFFNNPPALPNRTAPLPTWPSRFAEAQRAEQLARASGPVLFQPADMFKVWNTVWVGDPCKKPMFKSMQAQSLYFLDPPDASPYPRYRYYPNA